MLVLYNGFAPLSTLIFVVFLQQIWQGMKVPPLLTQFQRLVSALIDLFPN